MSRLASEVDFSSVRVEVRSTSEVDVSSARVEVKVYFGAEVDS